MNTPQKILITGLDAAVTEASVRAWLEPFGLVTRVAIIPNGDGAAPATLVEMDIGGGAAEYLVAHLNNYWHDGAIVNAWLLHH